MESPAEVQKIPQRPNPAEVKKHELLHLPYAAWCETCIAAKGKNNKQPAMASSTLEVETQMPKVLKGCQVQSYVLMLFPVVKKSLNPV